MKLPGKVMVVLAFSVHGFAATSAADSSSNWDRSCYQGFDADVASLSGSEAQDCGFVLDSAPEVQRTKAIACSRQALQAGKAFRVGYEGYGDDSGYCHAAVHTSGGDLLSVWVDQDVEGGGRTDGSHRTIAVSRCTALSLEPGTIYEGSFIRVKGCSEISEKLPKPGVMNLAP